MKHLKSTRKALTAATALLLAAGAPMLQSCEKDILTGQPSWLGNSIYDQLKQEGNYSYTLRLIDDLGQTNVLSQTGSKTLFVADDEAFDKWFQTNSWGVKKYEDLTSAQKKLIFNSSMVNNAYLIELLSNVSGDPPEEGMCMRRETAVSVFDSVSRIMPDEMPNTSYWAKYKDHKNGIVLLRDNTSKPMIHFLPAYMSHNKIVDADLTTLTNGESNSTSDAWVNGKKIIERDITCKNGYIHKVDGVMTSADNMADIIASHANMSTFNRLLGRFSAPYYDDAATKEYNRLYNNTDSVFVLRHFASTAHTGNYGTATSGELSTDPNGQAVDAKLLYDPTWNQYIYSNTSGYDLHYDAGAMLVPTNAAFDKWWNADGKVLQDMYGSWDNVPMNVLVKLMNINMINTFSETVPSKFKNIVDNTTKVSLGITAADVDSCFMGCNGVVYLLNKVFTPADYRSVSFPALINSNGADGIMSVIYWGIDNLNFEPYLNSMDSYYSFIVPTNKAMLTYIDPCSYGTNRTKLYRFTYNNQRKTVVANRYDYDLTTGTVDEASKDSVTSADQVKDRLEDLIDNLIVVGNIEDGHTYYKTKGGSPIIVRNAGKAGQMIVNGALQQETGTNAVVTQIYDESTGGNGKAYVVEDAMPLSSQRSTFSILSDNDKFSVFTSLLRGSSLLATRTQGQYDAAVGERNINVFDNYNYTVYVPTNATVQKLIDDGYLPTWDDMDALTADDFGGDKKALEKAQTTLTNMINNFLRYHIQDNSVFIAGTPQNNVRYESSKINPANKRYYSITVNADDNSMTVEDQVGNTRKVLTADGLYNIIGREYWFQNRDKTATNQIYQASDVVVHQIDGPLFYEKTQFEKKWREVIGLTTTAAKRHNYAKARRR